MSSPDANPDLPSDQQGSADHVSTDAGLQEANANLSHLTQVIDSVTKEAEVDRLAYIKKRVEGIPMKLAGITQNNHMLSVERQNLGTIEADNLLTKRMKEAIDKQNGQKDKHASVIRLGRGRITLPKVEKIPPYTTWVFPNRNQLMKEDQSVVGRRRLFYDKDECETLICSDSEEETTDNEDNKIEFVESEDKIIWSTVEQTGSSDIVCDLLAQRLSRKPCEIKERYEALKCPKPMNIDSNTSSFLDKDLEAAQDSLDKLFCRRCSIFGCKLHRCSQELVYPAEKKSSTGNNTDGENVPCGPYCYLQKLEAHCQKSSSQKDSECSKSDTRNVHDVNPINSSPPSNKEKSARESVNESNESKESSSSSPRAQMLSTTKPMDKDSITDFESWRTLEKSLFKKGVEIFRKNSCLITRNVMGEMKTCVEVYHALLYHENVSSQGGNSSEPRTENIENMCTAQSKLEESHAKRSKVSHKDLHNRQYNPCGCQSSCGDDCSCLKNGTCCEKYCGCPKTCKNRYRGCYCPKSQCRSRQCPCFATNRECDPDVCRQCRVSCGDGTIGSPSKNGEDYECKNMKLLLGQEQQRVLLGMSRVKGWGVFTKNNVVKDAYLGEYTGELISHREADKRGKIYDREKSSFLFNLNDQFVVDGKRIGSKMKFINHSKTPNCYAKVMMVAGDHRIAIFAKKKIGAGEELFCDYGYEPNNTSS